MPGAGEKGVTVRVGSVERKAEDRARRWYNVSHQGEPDLAGRLGVRCSGEGGWRSRRIGGLAFTVGGAIGEWTVDPSF
jgi:hypothetical protein